MNLQFDKELFIVGGASSGLGEAIAKALLKEGARVIAIARSEDKLEKLKTISDRVEVVVGSLFEAATLDQIMKQIDDRKITGAVINAGGPPAMSVMNTTLEDWDAAYQSVFRWKVDLTQRLVKKMIDQQYGRIVFVESISVKNPVENLVLSNSMRMAVVGYVKTLAQEIGHHGVTLNILAPGYHATQRLENLFKKNSELKNIPVEDIRATFINQTKVKTLGEADDFATLGIWLLSPQSRYVTGQTISVDGGLAQGVF